MRRVICCEVYELLGDANGDIAYGWLWVVISDGERRFVRGPECAPPGSVILRRGEAR